MSSTLKERDVDPSLDELLDSPQKTNDWTAQLCLTLDLAQDQKAIKIIEGGRFKTYSGRHTGTDEDAQSDAGREILKGLGAAVLEAVHQAWVSQRVASGWNIAEENLGTNPSFDAEPPSCEAERDDQPSPS